MSGAYGHEGDGYGGGGGGYMGIEAVVAADIKEEIVAVEVVVIGGAAGMAIGVALIQAVGI